jgi:hypothetical protein
MRRITWIKVGSGRIWLQWIPEMAERGPVSLGVVLCDIIE